MRSLLEQVGRPIGAHDLLIGAHALHEDCVLVTHNTTECASIAGLEVEDWLADSELRAR